MAAGKHTVDRLDFQRIDAARVTETPQGFLRVSGNLTRVGVLPYHRADGTVYRELRLPSEVFRDDSLASMRYAPVTDLHGGMVDPGNVSDLQVGIVGEDVDHEGAFVTGSAIIQRRDTIDAVRAKKRRELSPGYRCWVQDEGGRWDGTEFGLGVEDYDGVQRDITYNHLAIGPENWGRSGPDVALRMDGLGEGAAYAVEDNARAPMIQVPADIGKPPRGHIDMKKITIVLDGGSFTVEVPEGLAESFEQRIAALKTKADSADELEGKLAAAEKTGKDLQGKLDAATDPSAIQAAIAERSKLVEDVKRIAPKLDVDEKLDSKSLKVAALVEAGNDAAIFKDKTDAFVDGMFAGAVSAAPEPGKSDEPPAARPPAAGAAPTVKTDHVDGDSTVEGTVEHTDSARRRMIERNRAMAAGKLDACKPGAFDA
jgi:hypothetical protein